jgi:carbon-monoxide dehydrogenase medium subunit
LNAPDPVRVPFVNVISVAVISLLPPNRPAVNVTCGVVTVAVFSVSEPPDTVMALGATIHTNTRKIAADDFFLGMYATALQTGELITAISFPIPKRASYAKFKQGASRFAMVGVFVADTNQGARVAVTGASNGVFRHAGLEAALAKKFSPESVAAVVVDESELNSDIHASAAYRAQLIKVQTRRAVQEALA